MSQRLRPRSPLVLGSWLVGSALALGGCSALGAGGVDKTTGNGGQGPGQGGAYGPTGATASVDMKSDPGGTSSTGAGTGGGAALPSCKIDLSAPHQDIRLIPEASRGVDSAIYARAVLRLGLAPDPSVLRADDFLSFYGSAPGYEGAAKDGEVEFLPSEGLVEARFWVPKPTAHVARSFVVVLDLSLSMQSRFGLEHDVVTTLANRLDASQGDRLVVLGWSSSLSHVYDSAIDASLEGALSSAFAKPSGASDLGQTLESALETARATTGERHVLLLTDGGVARPELSDWSYRFAAENVRLDAALLALSAELRDPKSPAKALRYNQELLSELTAADGTRLFVTDAAGATPDVKELFDTRFDELFGVAMAEPQAQVSLPPFLAYLPQAGDLAGTQLSARSVGYDRALTFRVHVTDSEPNLDPICAGIMITATLGPTSIGGSVLGGIGPLGQTRAAVRAFVGALRSPSKKSLAAAADALSTASSKTCTTGAGSARACAAVTEMTSLLASYPTAGL